MKIVTAAQMREIDARALQGGVTISGLMENAGLAVARETRNWLESVAGRRVLGLIGPGNNGGDGLVALRQLHDWGAAVTAYLVGAGRQNDSNIEELLSRNVRVKTLEGDGLNAFGSDLSRTDVFLDSVLGTGLSRPLSGSVKASLDMVKAEIGRRKALKVAAVDLPSGLDADTGAADPSTVPADLTVSLHLPKRGYFTGEGAGYTGRLVVADIGMPMTLSADVETELITKETVSATLPRRPIDSNKGTVGRAMVVAGSHNYPGAASLACLGAARAGAGLVTLASVPSVIAAAAAHAAEITYMPLSTDETGSVVGDSWKDLIDWVPNYSSLLVGPGLGVSEVAQEFVRSLFNAVKPLGKGLVLDADGLNNLAGLERWWEHGDGQIIITPHPGEMSRLTGLSVPEIQADRLSVAGRAAREWGVVVVLKGAFTVVAAPSGAVRICPFANPALATAGTGDVLSGIIAGLIAQGLDAFDSATCGVYIHTAAGEIMRERMGEAGGLASDLLLVVPEAMKRIRE